MVYVHTSHDGSAQVSDSDGSERRQRETVGTVEHCSCGLAGFLATAVVFALFYPTLVALASHLHLLSTTALVAGLVTVWLATWLAFELAWEWRSAGWSADA